MDKSNILIDFVIWTFLSWTNLGKVCFFLFILSGTKHTTINNKIER